MTLDEAIEQFKYDAECNRADLDLSFAEDNDKVAEWLEELKQYREIGAPDECSAAVEKQTAKKVKDVSMVRDNGGYIGRIGKCPCCEDIIEEDTLYCDCGQKLDCGDEK